MSVFFEQKNIKLSTLLQIVSFKLYSDPNADDIHIVIHIIDFVKWFNLNTTLVALLSLCLIYLVKLKNHSNTLPFDAIEITCYSSISKPVHLVTWNVVSAVLSVSTKISHRLKTKTKLLWSTKVQHRPFYTLMTPQQVKWPERV